MILTCPSCGARYRIDAGHVAGADDEQPPRPRRARCTACGTIFAVAPQHEAGSETSAAPAPPEEPAAPDNDRDGCSNEPRWWWRLALGVLLLVLFLFTIAALRPDWVERATGRPSPLAALPAIDLPRLRLPELRLPRLDLPELDFPRVEIPRAAPSPLEIEARTSRRRLADGRLAFEVSGQIRNPTATTQTVPPIELLLLDPAGRVVGRWSSRATIRSLAPGASTGFETSNIDPPPDAVALRVRLNPAEVGRL